MFRNSGPLSKAQKGGERQCTNTQDLNLKIRGEVGTQCRDTENLQLKVRGEVGDSVQTLRICI